MERIAFKMDGEDAMVDFYVLEQTTIGGVTYILRIPQHDFIYLVLYNQFLNP